jgi:hypothetical protein
MQHAVFVDGFGLQRMRKPAQWLPIRLHEAFGRSGLACRARALE